MFTTPHDTFKTEVEYIPTCGSLERTDCLFIELGDQDFLHGP